MLNSVTFLIVPGASILFFNIDQNGSCHTGKESDGNVFRAIMPEINRRQFILLQFVIR